MALEDIQSDLYSLRKLYGLLQNGEDGSQNARFEVLDEKARLLLKKLLDEASQTVFEEHSKIIAASQLRVNNNASCSTAKSHPKEAKSHQKFPSSESKPPFNRKIPISKNNFTNLQNQSQLARPNREVKALESDRKAIELANTIEKQRQRRKFTGDGKLGAARYNFPGKIERKPEKVDSLSNGVSCAIKQIELRLEMITNSMQANEALDIRNRRSGATNFVFGRNDPKFNAIAENIESPSRVRLENNRAPNQTRKFVHGFLVLPPGRKESSVAAPLLQPKPLTSVPVRSVGSTYFPNFNRKFQNIGFSRDEIRRENCSPSQRVQNFDATRGPRKKASVYEPEDSDSGSDSGSGSFSSSTWTSHRSGSRVTGSESEGSPLSGRTGSTNNESEIYSLSRSSTFRPMDPTEIQRPGKGVKPSNKKIGRLRKIKDKLAIVFHHHHHHHHKIKVGNGATLWKSAGKALHRNNNYNTRNDEVYGERAVTKVGKSMVSSKNQHGHFHALVEGLLRHIRHSRKSKPPKDGVERDQIIGKKGAKKLHWWQMLKRQRGVKMPNKPRVKLGPQSKHRSRALPKAL